MFFNKYKSGRNHGLLPKIQTKSASPLLTSHAIIEDSMNKEYQLMRHPNNKNSLFMYNDKEYLQRHCSIITNNNNRFETIKQISKLYPTHDQTFTLYVANSPVHSDKDILGCEQSDSILTLAFKDLKQHKCSETALVLSIIGIQNQNSLTDELNFEWIQKGINEVNKQNPIKATLRLKQKLKISKPAQLNEYIAHNLSIHSINSLSNLKDIIKRYQQIKNYFEEWVDVNAQTEYLPQGELYHLCEAQYDDKDGSLTKIIRSHYILRVNQYLRSTGPFLLRLGINFRKLSESNQNSMEIHESKIFRLLSHCFTAKNEKNQLAFHFHLFFQVGFYLTLKQQYFNLSIFSKHLPPQKNLNENNLNKTPFLYLKQYRQFTILSNMINEIEYQQSAQQKVRSYLESDSDKNQQRLRKVKSYASDTQSSLDRKISKYRRLTQQTPSISKDIDLQELVHETSKINNQINVKEITIADLKQNSVPKRIVNKQISLNKLYKRQQSFSEQYKHKVELQKLSQVGQAPHQDLKGDRENNIDQFYEKTKKWLGHVYGQKPSKRIKDIKSEMNKHVRRLTRIQSSTCQNKFNKSSNDSIIQQNT